MSSNITLYDDADNPVVVSGEDMKGLGGIGVDQTWQDMKASRAINTDYINDTTRPIMVNITGGSANVDFYVFVDSVRIAWSIRESGSSNTMSFIVPVGSVYKLEVSSATIGVWSELRGV